MVGAFINTFIHGMTGNIESNGDAYMAFGIGALSGAAGGGAGNAVAGVVGSIGFSGGAVTGAAGGVAGGFVSGTGNAWAGGASFNQGLKLGLIEGVYGGMSGGLVGGISGGINAFKYGGNFWSGEGATFDSYSGTTTGNEVQIGENMDYSTNYAQKWSDENFWKNVKGVTELRADFTTPEGYSTIGDRVLNKQGKFVKGTTEYLGFGKGSRVYLYCDAFVSQDMLYLTLGHEYIHAGFNDLGLMNGKNQHASIYKWENYQTAAFGYDVTDSNAKYKSFKPYYVKEYDYSNLVFFILSARGW